MNSLNQALNDLAYALNEIEENSGEITDKMLPVLANFEMAVSEKVDNYVYFFDTVQANIIQAEKTIEKFKKNLNTLKALENRLKNYAKYLMEHHNITKIDGDERSMKLVKNGGFVSIEKPSDMFDNIKIVNDKYIEDVREYVECKMVLVIKDEEEFKRAVHENKIKCCYELPRGNHVRFI